MILPLSSTLTVEIRLLWFLNLKGFSRCLSKRFAHDVLIGSKHTGSQRTGCIQSYTVWCICSENSGALPVSRVLCWEVWGDFQEEDLVMRWISHHKAHHLTL